MAGKTLTEEELKQNGLIAEDLFFKTLVDDPSFRTYPEGFLRVERSCGIGERNGIDGFAVVKYHGESKFVKIPLQVKTSFELFEKHYKEHSYLEDKLIEMIVHWNAYPYDIYNQFFRKLERVIIAQPSEVFEELIAFIDSKPLRNDDAQYIEHVERQRLERKALLED